LSGKWYARRPQLIKIIDYNALKKFINFVSTHSLL
jgi:hypothetical protein